MIRKEVEWGGGVTPGNPNQFQDEAPLYYNLRREGTDQINL